MGDPVTAGQKNWTAVTGYIAFLVLGLYYIVQKEFGEAASTMGIGLIFDPFNPSTPFSGRPLFQKLVLVVHLAAALTLFILAVMSKG
jgi:hypothetical protein